MSKRNGGDLAQIGGLALGLAFVGLCVAIWFSSFWIADAHRMQAKAYEHPAAHCQGAEDCAEQALKLQARELVSTEAMLDLAFAQSTFGFMGLVGLGITFFYAHRAWVEAKRSADAALKAFEADNRAWVTIKPVAIKSVTWDGETPSITLVLEAENVGQQPAFDVCLGLDTFVSVRSGAGQQRADSLRRREMFFNRPGSEIGTALISGETWRVTFSGPANQLLPEQDEAMNADGERASDRHHARGRSLSGACCVTYRSPNIDAIHASTCIIWITTQDRRLLHPSNGDMDGDDLRITFFGSRMT